MERGHQIATVEEESIAQEMGIEPGDLLLEINGQEIVDFLDYHYLLDDSYVEVLIRKADGEEWLLEIDKEEEEDLGLGFSNSLMDTYRSCSNHCIFCFIDQMPPGMRDTLYFKDDDSRLSFLQGNYVTLTNLKESDFERILYYHLSPINVSVHTTSPNLRCRMLRNRFAGDIMGQLTRLRQAGIEMNGQIVLCKGINDGPELERTVVDLRTLSPQFHSLSVVPVGLTKYRDHLYDLKPYTADDARGVLARIHRLAKRIYQETGSHFVYASDEWYLLAGESIPEEDRYDGYPQLENGVGMLRLLMTEAASAIEQLEGDKRQIHCTVATGYLAAEAMRTCAGWIREKFPKAEIEVAAIRNDFFGPQITVAGLLTGRDLIKQLSGRFLGEKLLITCDMLRSGEQVFLDDVTVSELEKALQIPVVVVDRSGEDLVSSILQLPASGQEQKKHRRRNDYEQTDCSDCGQTQRR